MTTPTVRTMASVTPSGTPDILVTVRATPPDNLRCRAAAAGLPGCRDELMSLCRQSPEWRKLDVLQEQITAARRVVAEADAIARDVAAAKALLESSPESDFAAKLRQVAAKLDKAEADKRQAQSDLAELERVLPGVWTAAESAVTTTLTLEVSRRMMAWMSAHDAHREKIEAAARVAEKVIAEAIKTHLMPALEGLALSKATDDLSHQERNAIGASIQHELLGPVPPGVTRTATGHAVAPPISPEAPDATTRRIPHAGTRLATPALPR